MKILYAFWVAFWWLLEANMAPKASQNGARGGLDFAPVFGLGGVLEGLGGVLGPLGAQELILIDF